MAPRVWPLLRFLLKGGVAGGAVLLAAEQQLLGPGERSQAALHRAGELLPPAARRLRHYVSEHVGLRAPPVQLPALPGLDLCVRDSWNAGVEAAMSALSAAPAKAAALCQDGWDFAWSRLK